jgi:hypothetical protein
VPHHQIKHLTLNYLIIFENKDRDHKQFNGMGQFRQVKMAFMIHFAGFFRSTPVKISFTQDFQGITIDGLVKSRHPVGKRGPGFL